MNPKSLCASLTLSLALAGSALAQTAAAAYPSRPVKIVVPYSAASTADNVARSIGERLSARLGQPFVVDNKAGAGGTIGVGAVAKAPADGYTLLLTTSSPLVISPLIDKTVTYDVEKDLVPVGLLGMGGLLLVASPSLPAKDLKELIALLRKKPGTYSYASNGNGSYSHMAMELFKQMAGIDLVHVPYKGPAQAETDVMAGQVSLMFDSVTTGSEMVKAGRLRAYGISSGQSDPVAPQFAPLARQGVKALEDFDVVGWSGLLAPRATPPAVMDALTNAVRDLSGDPAFRNEMLRRNTALVPVDRVNDMARLLRADETRWKSLVETANIRLD